MSICDKCGQRGEFCSSGDDKLKECPCFEPIDEAKHYQVFAESVGKIFEEEKILYKKKAEQYAQGDPLANFRGGAALEGMNPESLDDCFKVLLMYMAKHVAFVYQSGKLGRKEDESLGDIAVYVNIARAMGRMKRENEDET